MVIEIRGFSPDDEAAVRELLRKHGWEDQYIDGQLEALSDLAGSGSTFRAVSIAGGSLVGFVSSRYYAWNQLAQIHGLAVDPARLRSGIGTRLIVAAEEHGRGEGARGMYVDTPVDNEIARHFYLANGYADAYAMPRYYSDELDGVTFVKFFAYNLRGVRSSSTGLESGPRAYLNIFRGVGGSAPDLTAEKVSVELQRPRE